MQFKRTPLLVVYVSLLVILVVSFLVDDNVARSTYILVVATITVFIVSFLCNKVTSPASLLIISSFVFLGCRPFLSVFTNYDFRIADWFITGYMDDNVAYANYAISLMYFGYIIALVISKNTRACHVSECGGRYSAPSLKFLFILFILGSVGMVLKGLYFFYYIESNSYVGIYQNNISVPLGYNFLSSLFYYSFFLICAFFKKFRVRKTFLLVAVIIAAFSSLKGSRGEFITFLLTVICIYYNDIQIRNKKLIAKMLIVFLIVFALSEFISMWRSGGSFIALLEGNNPIVDFLYGMGVSYITVFQSVKLHMVDGISNISYLFSQIIITVTSILGIGVELPSISYSNLASATANPELYSEGYGLGGSYLSESLLAMGLIGCLIMPLLVLLLLNSSEKFTKENPLIYFVYFSILPPIFFIPRETLLYFFPYLLKSIFVAFFMVLYSNYKTRVSGYDQKKC